MWRYRTITCSGGEIGPQGNDAEKEGHHPAHEHPHPGYGVDATFGDRSQSAALSPTSPHESVEPKPRPASPTRVSNNPRAKERVINSKRSAPFIYAPST